MGHAELTIHDQAATKRISLDEYWMPFTPEPRIQGRPADGRPRGRDVPLERPRRQDHRRVVGPVLRRRRPRPQGDRRGRRHAAARARFLRAVPARAPEAVRARDARRRAHAGRPQPDLLRQLRLRVRRHGDEGRARLPPGARPGRAHMSSSRASAPTTASISAAWRCPGLVNNRRKFGPALPGIAHMRHTHLKENFFTPGEGAHGAELAEDLAPLRQPVRRRRTSPPASSSRSPARPAASCRRRAT